MPSEGDISCSACDLTGTYKSGYIEEFRAAKFTYYCHSCECIVSVAIWRHDEKGNIVGGDLLCPLCEQDTVQKIDPLYAVLGQNIHTSNCPRCNTERALQFIKREEAPVEASS